MTEDRSILWTVLIVIGVLILAPFLMMALMMPMMGAWGWTQGWTASPLLLLASWLIPLLVLAGIGYLIYRVATRTAEPEDDALQELRLAYARGDISDEEYEHRRARLLEEP